MEGILLDATVFSSTVAIVCGVAILATAVAAMVLGEVADREARGETVSWAEWPLPESEPGTPSKDAEELSLAA